MKPHPWPYGKQPPAGSRAAFRAECRLTVRRFTEVLELTAVTNFGAALRLSFCIENWAPGRWIEVLQLSSCCSEQLSMNRSEPQAGHHWFCRRCQQPHPGSSARAELYMEFAEGKNLEDYLPSIDRGRAIYESFARQHMDPLQAIMVVDEFFAVLRAAALADHTVRDAPMRHTDLVPLDGMNPQ